MYLSIGVSSLLHAEPHIIDGAGHVPTVNEPHTVVDLIEDWLWALDPGRET